MIATEIRPRGRGHRDDGHEEEILQADSDTKKKVTNYDGCINLPADLVTLQQQLRQEVADVIQQFRAEVNEAISGRIDMMNSISAALKRMTAKPAESKPYRISDLIPRNWEAGSEKGEFRSFMSDLHLWMQAWSDQGEQMLAMVESIDRFDSSVIAFDCSDEEFRSIESAL